MFIQSFFKISLSLYESPQLLHIIIVSLLNLGAILIASAKACAGSKLGDIDSSSVTNLYAFNASSSLAYVYLALPASFKKQCIGLTPG